MVLLHNNTIDIDASISMHLTVWKANGHADAFNDPLIDNRGSKRCYRVDNLIEDQTGRYEEKIEKGIAEAAKEFGESPDEARLRKTNSRVLESQKKRDNLHARYTEAMRGPDLEALKQIILDEGVVDLISGTTNWADVRQFNPMFSTEMGASADATNKIYLRPETAQGTFVNFLNVQKTGRMRLPSGTCQIGKVSRNKIVIRQFVFRMREFEQMEVQFFCQPGIEMKWFKYWRKHRLAWHESLDMGDENYHFHDHEKLAHYANTATGAEFHISFGFKEIEGIHSRTSFDLPQHEKHSGCQVKHFDPKRNENYTPYIIETLTGADRMPLSTAYHSYTEETLESGSSCVVLKLPKPLVPVKYATPPLANKDGLLEKAQEIVNSLKFHFNTHMGARDSIGKRYRRQDAIGIPFCATVGDDTLTDNTVTLRYRGSMKQERVPAGELRGIIGDRISTAALLRKTDTD